MAQIEDLKSRDGILTTDLEALKMNREAERAGRIRAEAALRKALSSDSKEEGDDNEGDSVGRKGTMIKEIGGLLLHLGCMCSECNTRVV
jgi:hypothetical protein